MSVIRKAPINAGMPYERNNFDFCFWQIKCKKKNENLFNLPATMNDVRYELVSSYKKPAIGAPAVNGTEHNPRRNPIA